MFTFFVMKALHTRAYGREMKRRDENELGFLSMRGKAELTAMRIRFPLLCILARMKEWEV